MNYLFRTIILICLSFLQWSCSIKTLDPMHEPMADIHLHFNWNQEEIISAKEVVSILKKHHVSMAVVSSRPSANALKLRQQAGNWILPIYSPYYKAGIKHTWFRDKQVLTEARKALGTGQYYGIGEMHLVSGMGPNRNNAIVRGLFELAIKYQLPILIHTDSSSYEYFLPLCQQYKQINFLWAHAGGILDAQQVGALMQQCANVWVEMSARDPWHYGLFTDENMRLLPGWKALFETFPDRFMTGTDPVWNAHQTYRWYEADEGWSHYQQLNNFHRQWLQQLDPELEKKIRLENALSFFKFRIND